MTKRRKKRLSRSDFPPRLLFFCDCGATFDRREILLSHAEDCTFASLDGYPERDAMIEAVERMMFSASASGKTFDSMFLLLALQEIARDRGLIKPGIVEELIGGSKLAVTVEATDEEVDEKLVEVGSWYGYTKEEVENGATCLTTVRLESERKARAALQSLLDEQGEKGIPLIVILDSWRNERSGEAMVKVVLVAQGYVKEMVRRSVVARAEDDEALRQIAHQLGEEIKAGEFQKMCGPVVTVGLEELARRLVA